MATTPDLSSLSTSFLKFGGQIIMKAVNAADYKGQGIQVYKNVKAPIPLTKLSAQGGPRPYREQDDTTGNGVKFEDRILTVYNSKWDYDIDPEKFRNTYLADETDIPFYQYILEQVANEYVAAINDDTAYLGVYNASGTAAVDIATGWGTIIANEIIATNLTPVVTGAITSSNAVTKVKLNAKSVPLWMRKKKTITYCSYNVFDKFCDHYETLNGYQYKPDNNEEYKIQGVNSVLMPVTWMGASQRLITSISMNLAVGTDGESVKIASSVRRNIIEMRPMMPVGFQISDLEALVVNDQA